MILPKQVKIGPITYRVSESDAFYSDDGARLQGQIRYNDAQIVLLASLPDTKKQIVFWHEVLHGMLESTGHEQNELLVGALSYGLVQLFEANGWRIEVLDGHAGA